jgi:hypothetical protein
MNMGYSNRIIDRVARGSPGLLAIFLAACVPAAAQLSPAEPDPLARIRDAAKTNVQACSATGETLCEQVAPKIIANAQGDSPLAENLRRLTEGPNRPEPENPRESPAVAWAVAAFRDAGVEVRTEEYLVAAKVPPDGVAEIVVAEIRGREKPEEWVMLGADLNPSNSGSTAVEAASNAALVVEAARDIQLTGVRPRRSIRFLLFGGEDQGMTGAWAYLRAHRNELDRARGAFLFDADANRSNGFALNGRHDIESGVREAMKPAESMGALSFSFNAPDDTDSIDLQLEGIPTVVGTSLKATGFGPYPSLSNPADKVDVRQLKHNTAIAAVAAFGIAERAEPIGQRQSRAEIESLLKTTGLADKMKANGIWPLWESGRRGRVP